MLMVLRTVLRPADGVSHEANINICMPTPRRLSQSISAVGRASSAVTNQYVVTVVCTIVQIKRTSDVESGGKGEGAIAPPPIKIPRQEYVSPLKILVFLYSVCYDLQIIRHFCGNF